MGSVPPRQEYLLNNIRHVLPALREKLGNPGEMKNLETVAQGFIAWWNHQSPGAYDAFCKRIGA